MPNPGEEALERFQKWCTAEGVTFDREALEIRVFEDACTGQDNRYHYAVYARHNLKEGDAVITAIPKAACLSARTCSVAVGPGRLQILLATTPNAFLYHRF